MEQLANEIYQYIAQQENPVSVRDILSHLSTKPDRRTVNQILIAMTWDGDLKKELKDGKAYYTAPEAEKEKLLDKINETIGKIEAMAKDAGIDLHASNIGDTGFDLYRWTFAKGTRQKGKGWSVAIPDGFQVIASSEGRVFEAVPQGTEDTPSVRLLPGIEQDFNAIQGAKWSYHLQARKGRVDAYGAALAQIFLKTIGGIMDTPPDVITVVTDQVSAAVVVQDTDAGSFSYQIQMLTEGKSQALRVQTGFMTPEQKEHMTQSITEWVKTFRFDKPNPAIPQKAPLSDPGILTQLKNGFTSAFDKEVDLAVEEAEYGLAGQLGLQKYRVEQDLAEGDGSAAMQQAMDDGMEIVAYYTRAAEKLTAKLEKEKLPAKTMEHVYTKLQELILRMDNLRVNGTPIRCNVPGDVQKAWEKWVTVAEDAKKQEAQKSAQRPPRNTASSNDSAIQSYLSRSERKLRDFQREWKNFTEDVPGTLRELVTQGMRPSFSTSSAGGQIGVSMSFNQDISEAKQYMEELQERMDQAISEIQDEIMDIDRDMDRFQRDGIDSRQLAKLIENLNNWIDYIPEMRFAITDERSVNFRIPQEVSEIKRKWKRITRDTPQRNTANAPQRSTTDIPKAPPRSSAPPSVEDIKERVKQKALKREEEYRQEREAAEKAEMDEYQQKMQDYRAACARYELDEKKVKREREAHFKQLCDNERNNRLKELDRIYYSTCSDARVEIERQRKRLDQAKSTLSQLKFWNIFKKSEQKKIIEDANQVIARKEAAILDATRTWQNEKDKVILRVKEKEKQFREIAEKSYPLPVKPTEPQKPSSQQTARSYPTCGSSRSYSGTPSEASIRNRKLAEILKDRMEYDIWYTGSDLAELLQDECPGCNSSKITAIMRLTDEDVEYDSRETGRVYRLRKYSSNNRSEFRQPPQKPSGFREEGERLAQILLARMEYGEKYTSLDLAELMEDVLPACNSSKIVAIMRLVPEGRVEVDKVNGRNVYSLA